MQGEGRLILERNAEIADEIVQDTMITMDVIGCNSQV
jgi:hypothetical protein